MAAMLRYYRTSDPGAVKAANDIRVATLALRDASDAFAALFGGARALLSSSLTRRAFAFAGLTFDPTRDPVVWTKPDRQHRMQTPRVRPARGANAEQRAEHERVSSLWSERRPRQDVHFDELFSAIGTSWGELAFCGIGWAVSPTVVYVKTSARLASHMVEITASEFEVGAASSEVQ